MTSEKEDLPSAVAADLSGNFNERIDEEKATHLFSDFISSIVKDCASSGAVMIGHVKANVRSEREMISMSSTTLDGKVRLRSVFSVPIQKYEMTVNVIVYGVNEETICKILEKRRKDLGNNSMTVLSDTGCKDPECNDPDCSDGSHRIIRIV